MRQRKPPHKPVKRQKPTKTILFKKMATGGKLVFTGSGPVTVTVLRDVEVHPERKIKSKS